MRQKTLLKIIGLMRMDLEKGHTILEISKNLEIGYRPAYMHIIEMQKEGIIKVEKVGSSKFCKLNLGNNLTRHLLESFDILKSDEILKSNHKLKNIIEIITNKISDSFVSEIHSIILYGSYAKRNETKNSDIDLLFIVSNINNKKIRELIERECASFKLSYNLTVNPLITDIPQFQQMLISRELNVGLEIRKSGISIYGHEIFWRVLSK